MYGLRGHEDSRQAPARYFQMHVSTEWEQVEQRNMLLNVCNRTATGCKHICLSKHTVEATGQQCLNTESSLIDFKTHDDKHASHWVVSIWWWGAQLGSYVSASVYVPLRRKLILQCLQPPSGAVLARIHSPPYPSPLPRTCTTHVSLSAKSMLWGSCLR